MRPAARAGASVSEAARVAKPGNPRYRQGADFERRVMVRLNLLGWTCVRSAGSHGPADIVAIAPRDGQLRGRPKGWARPIAIGLGADVLLIQAKAGRTGHYSEQDRVVFMQFANACGATACYADQVQGVGVRVIDLESGKELG